MELSDHEEGKLSAQEESLMQELKQVRLERKLCVRYCPILTVLKLQLQDRAREKDQASEKAGLELLAYSKNAVDANNELVRTALPASRPHSGLPSKPKCRISVFELFINPCVVFH